MVVSDFFFLNLFCTAVFSTVAVFMNSQKLIWFHSRITQSWRVWFWLGSASGAGKVRTSALECEIPAAVLNGTHESHFCLSLQFS